VRIELEYPDVELPTMLSTAYCVPEHVITPRGRDWLRPEFLVSNGAYALEQWAPGAKVIRLRRNPHYHDAARVAIPRVDWLTGYDDGTRLSLFRLGEVEDATIEDAGNLGAARRDLAASLRSSPEASVGWLGFNVTRGRMADPRLRLALSLAIDRRLITDKVRGLGEQPSDALLPPGLPGHGAPPLPPYADWPMPRRLATARELLRQAGIAPGPCRRWCSAIRPARPCARCSSRSPRCGRGSASAPTSSRSTAGPTAQRSPRAGSTPSAMPRSPRCRRRWCSSTGSSPAHPRT
jgi:ABC-type oligopeptide transport system substrate-binding subunit